MFIIWIIVGFIFGFFVGAINEQRFWKPMVNWYSENLRKNLFK